MIVTWFINQINFDLFGIASGLIWFEYGTFHVILAIDSPMFFGLALIWISSPLPHFSNIKFCSNRKQIMFYNLQVMQVM